MSHFSGSTCILCVDTCEAVREPHVSNEVFADVTRDVTSDPHTHTHSGHLLHRVATGLWCSVSSDVCPLNDEGWKRKGLRESAQRRTRKKCECNISG